MEKMLEFGLEISIKSYQILDAKISKLDNSLDSKQALEIKSRYKALIQKDFGEPKSSLKT